MSTVLLCTHLHVSKLPVRRGSGLVVAFMAALLVDVAGGEAADGGGAAQGAVDRAAAVGAERRRPQPRAQHVRRAAALQAQRQQRLR